MIGIFYAVFLWSKSSVVVILSESLFMERSILKFLVFLKFEGKTNVFYAPSKVKGDPLLLDYLQEKFRIFQKDVQIQPWMRSWISEICELMYVSKACMKTTIPDISSSSSRFTNIM